MNKNAIKKFATEARRELISRVSQRALKYGISDKEVGDPSDDSVGGHLLSSKEKKQRAGLIEQIKEKGYDQVMEEVAYTWFNRFSALRFMEVNGYLPTRVRVFTDENNAFKPQILTEAIHMELDGLDMEKVYAYKEANDDDELYKYLLITQCNALNSVIPGMFQKIADYTELLFPDNLLREGSVVQQMIELIDEEDWKDAVQIIGWLYQYYNSEKKDEVFAALKKNVKITKENIPAATQLFTPDWIVRYMVENSLGRLWIEGHPNDKVKFIVDEREGVLGRELKSEWKYYLEEAEQEPDVQAQLASIREEYKALKPEDILCIDPCSGSGHILAYMFDVLMQIYESYGYTTREAVASIVENNLYGLDIDDRAAQLAYFSVMMKACQYDKRFLRRKLQPHVYAIVESNHVDRYAVEYFCNGDAKLTAAMDTIIAELHDAKEYGSIITVSQQDWDALYVRFAEIQNESVISIYTEALIKLKKLVKVAHILSEKYMVVVTNPPYMGSSGMSVKLNNYVKKYYPNSKIDLFAVFIEVCGKLTYKNYFQSMITQHAWMFLSSYEKLRNEILNCKEIVSMAHLGPRAFDDIGGEVVQTTSFILRNARTNEIGQFSRLVESNSELEKKELFLSKSRIYYANNVLFKRIPSMPIVYWIEPSILKIFDEGMTISDISDPRQGLATADNDRFVRFWWEVDFTSIGFGFESRESAGETEYKFFPYNKGGDLRRWYGSNYYVVDWYKDGKNIKADKLYKLSIGKCLESNSKPKNMQYYFRKGITWSLISSSRFGVRCFPQGMIFDVGSHCVFASDSRFNYLAAYLNSDLAEMILNMLNPTMNFSSGIIGKLPVIDVENNEEMDSLVNKCISIAKDDWDSNEYSWDYKKSPLLSKVHNGLIEKYLNEYVVNCEENEKELNDSERALNNIIEELYEISHSSIIGASPKKDMIHQKDIKNDIIDFISYAVGCMFGRYSLDVEGLAYAGGEWDDSKYSTFAADKDNIIPICDDEYFEDDIVGLFVKFVKTVYGADTLDENLKFIADALGDNGQPKEAIRKYFLNGFYKDHCKMYQKRPIYWMFDSGKKNGFKCLIYMHRYQPDTLARIRTDYVHEQQARYRTAMADLETRIANASTSERVKLNKTLKKLNDQATEIHEYEEKIHHLADQMISIDLDDGVKKNYTIFKDVLAKIK